MCLVGTLLYGNNMPSLQSLHFRSKSDSLNYKYYNIYIYIYRYILYIFIYRHTFYYISPVSPPGSILSTTSTFNFFIFIAGWAVLDSFILDTGNTFAAGDLYYCNNKDQAKNWSNATKIGFPTTVRLFVYYYL